jgi:hypothetical protein
MNNVTKTLLKNGIAGLANRNDEYFKNNITHALAFKLNASINEAYKVCSKKILFGNINILNKIKYL